MLLPLPLRLVERGRNAHSVSLRWFKSHILFLYICILGLTTEKFRCVSSASTIISVRGVLNTLYKYRLGSIRRETWATRTGGVSKEEMPTWEENPTTWPGLRSKFMCCCPHRFLANGASWPVGEIGLGARYTPSFLRLFLQIFFYFFVLEFFLAPHESVRELPAWRCSGGRSRTQSWSHSSSISGQFLRPLVRIAPMYVRPFMCSEDSSARASSAPSHILSSFLSSLQWDVISFSLWARGRREDSNVPNYRIAKRARKIWKVWAKKTRLIFPQKKVSDCSGRLKHPKLDYINRNKTNSRTKWI